MVNYTKPETRNRMCDRETYHLPPAKKMEAFVFSKDDCGKLSWDHKHVLVLDFLDHGDTLLIVIVVHLAYGGHFLQKTSVSSSEYCPFA